MIEEAATSYFDLASMDIEVMIEDNQMIDYDIVVIEAFKAGVEFSERWIPVEEELPEYNVPVLMKNQFGFYGIGEIEKGKWRFYSVESYAGMLNLKMYSPEEIAKVTHWRPINLK